MPDEIRIGTYFWDVYDIEFVEDFEALRRIGDTYREKNVLKVTGYPKLPTDAALIMKNKYVLDFHHSHLSISGKWVLTGFETTLNSYTLYFKMEIEQNE